MKLLTDEVHSPIGTIIIVSDGTSLRALDFDDCEERMHELLKRRYENASLKRTKNPGGASDAIKRYFEGELDAIEGMKVATHGTQFQELVWKHLRRIPTGKTWSYGELARSVGKPSASRAVGLANGSNPIAIVVPCHRVIGANGRLTGYAGGVARKRWLLGHEGAAVVS